LARWAYALKVELILDKLNQEATRKAVEDAIRPKDEKIDELTAKIDKLLERTEDIKTTLDKTSNELSESREDTEEAREEAYEAKIAAMKAHDVAKETKAQISVVHAHLTQKSFTSTMNPKDKSKHHYLAVTKFVEDDGTKVLQLTSGQKSYINKRLRMYINEKNHELVIEPFYNANGIDLCQNCKIALKEFRKQRLEKLNKDSDKTLHINDVPIMITAQKVKYTENKYIKFDELVQVMIDTNSTTQKVPIAIN